MEKYIKIGYLNFLKDAYPYIEKISIGKHHEDKEVKCEYDYDHEHIYDILVEAKIIKSFYTTIKNIKRHVIFKL